jgi:hypothetical protein
MLLIEDCRKKFHLRKSIVSASAIIKSRTLRLLLA